MDSLKKQSQQPNCEKHNLPVILYESEYPHQELCVYCILSKTGLILLENQQQELHKIINQENQICNDYTQMFRNINKSIGDFQINLNNRINKLLQMIQKQIQIIEAFQTKLQKQISNIEIDQMTIQQVKKESDQQSKVNENVKEMVLFQLNDLQNTILNMDRIFSIMKQGQNQNQEEKFQYEIVSQSLKREENVIYALEFNQESSILVIGYEKDIGIYKFKDGKIIKDIQKLSYHSDHVLYIYFMKQCNSFVSGSADKSIIIWEFSMDQNLWYPKISLQENNQEIRSIQMNYIENLLISVTSGLENQIKCWQKINNNWKLFQSITIDQQLILGSSLNSEENKLIIYGSGLVILSKQSDSTWAKVQTLWQVDTNYFAAFTFTNQILVLRQYSKEMKNINIEFYDFDTEHKQFYQFQELNIENQGIVIENFQIQWAKTKLLNFIAMQTGANLNLLKQHINGQYKLFETIKFNQNNIISKLSKDGQYLVVYKCQQKTFEVFKVKKPILKDSE